ncbi:MAG: sensor histidine kinase [Planctomycetaceae bacterium]|nr:ATP-binding protein [Planctomycetota bacterium]NUN51171.1 sensor histidine kinase [Planctomycetaceae bacterium]
MASHGLHSALEGLYYIPLLLAGYWWGRWPAGTCGVLVTGVYGLHTQFQLGGILDPANRGRLLALIIFPAVAFTTGLLADRLRRETQALLDAERQVRRAEMLAALGELSAGLAHEIRNPLASIRGAADVLAASFAPGSRDEEFARLLVSEVQRLDRVVCDFLQFARPGRAGDEFADPGACIQATFSLLRSPAAKANVKFTFDGAADGRLVRCPPEALRQVMLNLCLNALQAIGQGPGTVSVQAEAPHPERMRLVVDDTGPGVPPEQREAIFRPFHTTKDHGTGLGLSVVAKIVSGCGGTVHVTDGPEGGARFIVELPLAPPGIQVPVPEVVG